MSNRKRIKRSERCDGCSSRATHFLVDDDGWTLRSCDFCWPMVAQAIRATGGVVSECDCPVCVRRAAALAGWRRLRASGHGGRPQAEPGPGARAAAADLGAGTLRGPV